MTVADQAPTIWDRVFTPADGMLSPDEARYLLRLDFSPRDHDRMAELSEQAADGQLDPAAAAELDEYLRVGHQLARLQSQARQALKRAGHDR